MERNKIGIKVVNRFNDYYSDGSFCDPVESRLDLVAEYREEEKSMSKYSIEEFRNTYFRKPKDVEECELYRKWFKDNTDVEVSNCLHESRMLTYVGHQYSGVDLNVLMFRSSEGVMPLRYIDIDRYMYNTPIKKEVKAMTLEEQLQEAENKVAEIKKQISNIPKKYEVELYVEFTDQDLGGSLISYLGFRRWNLTKFAPGGRKVKITIEEIKEN
jgi:hypothetical protein